MSHRNIVNRSISISPFHQLELSHLCWKPALSPTFHIDESLPVFLDIVPKLVFEFFSSSSRFHNLFFFFIYTFFRVHPRSSLSLFFFPLFHISGRDIQKVYEYSKISRQHREHYIVKRSLRNIFLYFTNNFTIAFVRKHFLELINRVIRWLIIRRPVYRFDNSMVAKWWIFKNLSPRYRKTKFVQSLCISQYFTNIYI